MQGSSQSKEDIEGRGLGNNEEAHCVEKTLQKYLLPAIRARQEKQCRRTVTFPTQLRLAAAAS
jgi:hypothetical protein